MPSKPPSPTAEYLSRIIEDSGLTYNEIAERAGFASSNFISMMRLGRAKVPLDRIPHLAEACVLADPHKFLRIALEEYHPAIWELLRGHMIEVLTESERELLAVFRRLNQDDLIEIDQDLSEALASLFILAAR